MAVTDKKREQIMAARRRAMGLMSEPDGTPRSRRSGEGSIRFKSGAWEITLRAYKGAPQEPWDRLKGKSLQDAEAELDRRVSQVKAGTYVSRAQPQSVEDLWNEYLKDLQRRVAAGLLGQARADDLSAMMRAHILPAIGADKLSDVRADMLLEYIAVKLSGGDIPRSDRAKQKLSPRTINKHIDMIGMMFSWAMHRDRRYVTHDPTEDVDQLEIDAEETEPYELDHVLALISLLPDGTERRIGEFIFATGCRIGEALGTQEASCDEKAMTVKFRHAIKRSGGRSVLAPRGKNRAATRDFKHGQELAALLAAQKAHNATLPQVCSHLFRTPSGTQWNPSNYRNRYWYPAVYAGFAKVMPESLKTTWLSAVPPALRDAAILLTLDHITVDAVLDARWDQLAGNELAYDDACGRRRVCVIPDDLAARMAARRISATDRRIFPGRKRQRIGLQRFLEAVFRDPLRDAGIDFDRRIHRARHTYVSLIGAVEPELPARQLQDRIGHSSAQSTATYMHTFKAHAQKPADVLPFLTLGMLPHTDELRLRQAAELMRISPEALARAIQDAASEQDVA